MHTVVTWNDGDWLRVPKAYSSLVKVRLKYICLIPTLTSYLPSGEDEVDEDDSDDEEFHYPGTSPNETMRAPSITSNTTDYFGRASSTRGPTDLTPHLSQASEFRVPTHEAPQKVMTSRWTPPTPHQLHAQWERDDAVTSCRECRRRFTFLNRRVRCAFSAALRHVTDVLCSM